MTRFRVLKREQASSLWYAQSAVEEYLDAFDEVFEDPGVVADPSGPKRRGMTALPYGSPLLPGPLNPKGPAPDSPVAAAAEAASVAEEEAEDVAEEDLESVFVANRVQTIESSISSSATAAGSVEAPSHHASEEGKSEIRACDVNSNFPS